MDELRDAAGVARPREGRRGSDFFATLIAQSTSATEDALRRPPAFDVPAPTPAEQHALPIGSVPYAWLQMTSSMRRHEMGFYLDGVSMLLELALRGLLDVPAVAESRGRSRSGSAVVVGAAISDGAALDGALERLLSFGEPLEAQSAAARLAPYIGALAVPSVGAAETRARVADAIVGDGATDVRTALIVWMLKQDAELGARAFPGAFPRSVAVTRRALRRARPTFNDPAEHEVAAYRVLFATFIFWPASKYYALPGG